MQKKPESGTARQRVRTALAHQQPERVPFSWQFCATPEMSRCLDEQLAARGISWNALRQTTEDIVWLNPNYCGPAERGGGPWDVWGIRWKDVTYGHGTYREVDTYPLAGVDSVAALDDYPWPDPAWYDYAGLPGQIAAIAPDKAVKFLGFNPFETLCWMTGLEEVLCNCAMQPELVVRGLEHIVGFYEQRLARSLSLASERADIVFFFDDLGSQSGPLISPAMYRDLIKPFHRRLFTQAHELAPNAKVMMHSDGSVFALLDDLIGAGIDVLEAVQIECADMAPRKLKSAFGDRLSFHGAISVQQLLPRADSPTVKRTCRELVDILGAGGGYVAAPSHAIQLGTPVDNVLAMLNGVLGDDDYAAALGSQRLERRDEMNKPNIIMILCDDLGYGDCSCYGQQAWTTPAIDRMASEGLRFTDFYTTSPVCSPARASILTGLHSGHLPIRHLGDPYLPDDLPTIPWQLKDQGYVSACIGKYGAGNRQPDVDALRKGFDYHYGYNCMCHAHNYFPPFLRENGLRVPLRNRPPAGDTRQWESGIGVAAVKVDYSPDLIEARALEFLRDCAQRPFFLHYCPTLPHANNEGGNTPDGMEVDTYGDFTDRDWAPNEKGFARMVQRIDQTVGRVLDTVRDLGIAENTLVLFSSDNGPHNEGGHSVTRFNSSGGLQGYKRSLHEGGIRIPLIAWRPGTIAPGVSPHQGFFPDLLATFCELTGAAVPPITDGISLAPLLTGNARAQRTHEHLYFEYEQQLAVRQGDWKFFRFNHGKAPLDLEHTNDDEALYNLADDRHEDRDIKSERPDILRELKACVLKEHRDYTPRAVPPFYDRGGA